MSIENSNIYVNREISWLKFNERVLEEAEDQRVPLMERLRFVSIYGSNLDEFMMIRVGTLFDSLLLGETAWDSKTNLTPQDQLDGIFRLVKILSGRLCCAYTDIVAQLRDYNVQQINCEQMDDYEREIVTKYYNDELRPLLSPQIVDKQHPFPFFINEKLYVGLHFKTAKDKIQFGVIPVSDVFSRLFTFPGPEGVGYRFVLVEDIIAHFADNIFSKYKIQSKFVMRVTRNGDININEGLYDEDIDWRDEMERLLKKRRRSTAVRLQLSGALEPELLKYLCKKLDLTEREVVIEGQPLDLSFIYPLTEKLEQHHENLYYDALPPVLSFNGPSMIERITKQGDMLLSLPFQSIKPFLDLVEEAAMDPLVVSIKITLYRVASNSKLVSSLIKAAENGKDVLVMFELRARFDEQNNINWSKQLEEAGCTVIYGVEHFKVHSKLMVITRKDKGKLSYICQIGTGNYNEKTARIYTDLSLITANEAIAKEALNVFQALLLGNFVEESNHLLVAPLQLRNRLLDMIAEQTAIAKVGGSAEIMIKINAISDKELIDQLLLASQAGVKIKMFVRGICCFRAGIPGISDNITVKSIVGRFLEHSRIYVFGVGERRKIYIGSADWMSRNTQFRVEVACEILDDTVKAEIMHILDVLDSDDVKARQMDADGKYQQLFGNAMTEHTDSQRALYQYYAEQGAETNVIEPPKSFWEKFQHLFKNNH